jgi:hypothetical protein
VRGGNYEPGNVVQGRGFFVQGARNITPLAMKPLVWEELELAVTSGGARARGSSAAALRPRYAVVDVGALEGEVFVLPNHTMPAGHFLLFDLLDPLTDEALRGGNVPPAWR